jgi:DNA-binding transcriptional regulator YiaG
MTPDEIRAFRDKADLTQRELADLLEISPSAVAQWETGVTSPSENQVVLMTKMEEAIEKREEKEWRRFLMRTAGSLSLAVWLKWYRGDL